MLAADADPDYAKGIGLIYAQLYDTLKKMGLEPMDTVGQTFDPNLHQAVERLRDADAEPLHSARQRLVVVRLDDEVDAVDVVAQYGELDQPQPEPSQRRFEARCDRAARPPPPGLRPHDPAD